MSDEPFRTGTAMQAAIDEASLRARSEDLARRIADARAGRWPEVRVAPPYRPLGFFERQRMLESMNDHDGDGDSFLTW